MRRFIYRLATGIAVIAAVAACDLNIYPDGAITYNPGDQIITTEADLNGWEVAVMVSLRGINYGVYDYASDVMMDYFNAAVDFGNNGGSIHRSDNSFTSGNSEVTGFWSGCYSAIKNFNIFLEGSLSVPAEVDRSNVTVARGEAFFGRAYAYLILARHFGPAYASTTASSDLCVPLVTVYDQNARPARASVQEVYDRIRQDLDSAAVCLSGVTGSVRAQRPTVDAVNAMYARYFLDTRDWADAAAYAVKVISTGRYSLSRTSDQMTNEWVYDSGNEPIMQYYASKAEGTGDHSLYYSVTKMSDNYYTSEYFIPTAALVGAYYTGDLRKSAWFGTAHPYHAGWLIKSYHLGTYYNEDQSNPDYYVFSKYKGNPDYYTSYPNSAQAIKPLLIAEMYLIAAEAYFMQNDTADAATYLNALQSARGTPSLQATLENIKTEWYRETVGQGLRMSCLKRWRAGFDGRAPQEGAADIVMTGAGYDEKSLSADAYQFCWPVPSYEMTVNKNLVQNPGYDDLTDEEE